MDAAERARKISDCAGDISHCQGLGSIYGIAEYHIRQAEQAARLDERRKVLESVLSAVGQKSPAASRDEVLRVVRALAEEVT